MTNEEIISEIAKLIRKFDPETGTLVFGATANVKGDDEVFNVAQGMKGDVSTIGLIIQMINDNVRNFR